MPQYTRTLYRLQDDESHTLYNKDYGFLARDLRTEINFNPRCKSEKSVLFRTLDLHLDWGNRIDTPFISVYDDRDTAIEYAMMRLNRGKTGVRIGEIEVGWHNDVEFRSVPKLAESKEYEIDYRALSHSRHECLVLHWIPPWCIVGWITTRQLQNERDRGIRGYSWYISTLDCSDLTPY